MLCGRDDALPLDSLDHRYRNTRCQERIFSEIFEVAAIHRCAVDVHAWSENEMHATRTGISAHGGADPLREVDIPRSCQRDARRICSRQAVVVNAHGTVGHSERGDTKPRNGASVEVIDAPDDLDFFLLRHLAEDRIDPLFHFYS